MGNIKPVTKFPQIPHEHLIPGLTSMTHVELMREIADLRARNMAQRQIIARLLAYVALKEPNPKIVLADFSEAGDLGVDQLQPENQPTLEIVELMRREKDYLVALARQIVELG